MHMYRAKAATLPTKFLMLSVRGYQLLLSPWLGNSCRFEPTCSSYSLQALELHGAAAGTYLTLRRLARCNPLCAGGHDPVPDQPPPLFAWAVRGRSSMPSRTPSNPTHKTPQ